MSEKKNLSLGKYIKIARWSLGIGYKYSKIHFILVLTTQSILGLRRLIYAYFFAQALDDVINLAGNGDVTILEITKKLLIIIGFSIFVTILKSINHWSSTRLRYIAYTYQKEYEFTKLFHLGLQTLQDPEVNKLRVNATRWLHIVDNLNLNLFSIFSNAILFIIAAIYLFKIVPILFPIFLVYMIILIVEKRFFFKKSFEFQTNDYIVEQKGRNYQVANKISDPSFIGEISIVGSFSYLSSKFIKFFKKYNNGLFKIFDKQRFYHLLLDITDTMIIFWGYIETFRLLIEGQISIGTTTFYISTIDGFDAAVYNFSSSIISANDLLLKLSKVYEFYNLEPKVKDGTIMLSRLEEPPSIEFKNVSFTYPNSKNKIFENLNLKINPGEKIAIVGVNGAGKSTLTKLIARLYNPQKGEILINGNNLRDLKIDDWYKNMGLLFQDFKIYDMLTVQENIYIGKTAKKMNKGSVIESARYADAHEFISKYPKKYKTIMNERYENGIQPSKGQKQKIAIARFFYRDAPLVIFDEPTSAIDSESEYKIFNRIYNFFDNKTVVIISHRFSTVRNADRIIVLDDGEIIEEGSHKELIGKNGKYAQAFRLQADGYKE